MRAILLLPIVMSLGACGPPECQCLSPQVWVDACAEPQMKVGGELIGGVEDCSIDFDVVGVFAADRTVRFTNPGVLEVALDIELESDAFTIVSAPTSVAPRVSADAVFRFDPGAGTQALVIVTTDAANILGDTIEIELNARSDGRATPSE